MYKKLIVGNWKMYNNTHDASLLLHALSQKVKRHHSTEVVLCPNFLALQSLSLQVDRHQFRLGAQNCYWRDEGAFTGEVSAAMLRGVADYVIVGHSERRHIFHETEHDIRQKVQAVLRNAMQVVVCVGETAQQRADRETIDVIRDQVASGLRNVTGAEVSRVVIAYEPVWAIGTGDIPLPADVVAIERAIRKEITALYGGVAATALRIVYGGSVKADNASDFLRIKGIDGLLVGGASLQPEAFASIIEQAHTIATKDKK